MEKELLELIAKIPELKELGQSYITYKYVELFAVPLLLAIVLGGVAFGVAWAIKKYDR